MMVTVPVKTSIGCMEFGRQCSAEQVEEFVKLCMEKGIYDFDTAYMYTGGKSEEIMGNISSLHSPEAFIATKANPWTEKGLKYDGVVEQMNVSLERLKKDCVDLFYLHAPDHATPIEETLAAVNHLYREGKFKSFGLSNYASWQVAEIYYLCKQNNYPLPTFYQGMYNSVTRQVEEELFPCLRRFEIAFYAYNPLAGGLLTGKHHFEDRENSMIQHGRYSGTGPWSDVYLKRYWKKPLFKLIDQLKLTLDSIYGVGKVSLVDASIRWMYHHSKMDGANGDAVIIGASSVKHLRENLESTKQGPLHEDVVKIFEEAWGEIKGDCPLYFR
ncbi:aflatoxin B1 aldehyde reductase member 2-like isoform X2 [Acropora millepora]|uniref:aflatoxin B1 aldehyde reductase member 2-like isoform X2 n=1 Tax=Acropora millepora TaxID=45264 RepID=UPI001CF50C89|nr:aflatoxin B1 aldehyde reductase member 2-like isoform X2 [Acropora millepora]